ncbi:MAG: TIR domain-containing protein [Chlorobiaceae bacterium]|nr:TIR domain-containing protein [Chlorobiaceae bacterium]
MSNKYKPEKKRLEDNRPIEEVVEERIKLWQSMYKKNSKNREYRWINSVPTTYLNHDYRIGLMNSEPMTYSKYLNKLFSVNFLDLSCLGLESIPENLRNLSEVEYLSLNNNQLSEIPSWFTNLISLKAVMLRNNRLKLLPHNISKLNNLIALDVSNNQLGSLPIDICNLPLFALQVKGNPALDIPESLTKSFSFGKTKELLRYYFESLGEKGTPLLELKLLLVGRGKAGKTSLVKRLAGEIPNENESETHSISIRELTLECPKGQVRTRAWDFGGQEILHSTHQFFLTERSLYLLVLEPRTGAAQRDAEYWLKLIETQGGGSPVIVVMNWSHGRRWRVDEVKLKRKFPFIVDFLPTDALHGDGIEELQRCITKTVEERMQDVWHPFPGKWRGIKNAIAGMQDNFLTYQQYTDLCAMYGETDPTAQADLASILHALGLALYFGRDPRLHDTRVLNPGWVTGGVYSVIRALSVAENDGQLAVCDMPRVLREAEEQKVIEASDYPAESHQFILELMRAFQLCYASEEQGNNSQGTADGCKPKRNFQPGHDADEGESKPRRYLVPELLPEFEPEMPQQWEKAPVRLRYRYEVLPPGLLPRFIVRTHALSDGAPHWRHGVVLRHAEAEALIRAESDRPELYVFVLGGDEETRQVLVAMVRRELETLHAEMRMLPVEELELTGECEHWIGVKALREVEQPENPTQKLPVQPDGTAEVNVPHELDKLLPSLARAIDRDPATAPLPVRLFVSYAHDDEKQLKRLDAILDVLEQQHGLTSWHDKRLIAGDEWDEEIRYRLEEMDIFLFIASQTSLVRPYIKDPELKRAKERRKAGEIEIVSVKLEPCACDDDTFLGKLQRLAASFKSIAETRVKSTAWEQVRKDLLPVISRVRSRKKAAINQ